MKNQERFARLIQKVGKGYYIRFIDRVRQAVRDNTLADLKATASSEVPITTTRFRLNYIARAVRAGYDLDASDSPPHEGESAADRTGYWFQSHWPLPDGRPREDLWIWLNEGNLATKDSIRTGDNVIFFLTRHNPDGKPGTGTIFASGRVVDEEQNIHEVRGKKVWRYKRRVQPEIRIEPEKGITPEEARRLVGWHPDDPFYQRSGQIEEDEFEALHAELRLRFSGTTEASIPPAKYCRICWNTARWQKPVGQAPKAESRTTFVGKHGFGHEEWLLNFGHLIDGWHYAYLRPIDKGYEKWKGKTLHIVLYARSPEGLLLIGRIKACQVISPEDAAAAVKRYRANGWLQEMGQHLNAIGVQDARLLLQGTESTVLFNVKFRPEDLTYFEPYIEVPPTHPLHGNKRYQLFDLRNGSELLLDNAVPSEIATAPPRKKQKSEASGKRAAQEGAEFDPVHNRVQNRLYDLLVAKYGEEAVGYEDRLGRGYADLRLTQGQTTLFEVKQGITALQCIREAVGQLLEYSCFPSRCLAEQMIVVGLRRCTDDESSYLAHLRDKFGIPIGYWFFDVEERAVVQRCGIHGPDL